MIDSVLDEYRAIKIELERKNKREQRILKYYGIREINNILQMDDIVFDFFDKLVAKLDISTDLIEKLIDDIIYWDKRSIDELDMYKFYKQYLSIRYEHSELTISSIEKNIELWEKKFNTKIQFINLDDEIDNGLILDLIRGRYFNYLTNKYKQLCQTTIY